MEVQTGGSDTLNSGLFDTASTGKPTDLTTNANTANTSAPIVSSATYNFVNQDIGNWLFVQAGTNWIPGWYSITAVSSNKATLNAAIGAAILTNYTLNTAVGCATVGTPTAGVWAVDYSQQGGVQFSLTGITTAAANAILLSASFTKAMVGNGIQITGSTANFITGFYQINAVSAGVSATVDRNATTAAGVGGTAGVGGALASPGIVGSIEVNGNRVWIKNGTYTVTSASTNVAAGCVSTKGAADIWSGYSTLRGDDAATPIIKADGVITTFTLVTTSASGTIIRYLEADGNSRTSSRGFSMAGGNTFFYRLRGKNCTNNAFLSASPVNQQAAFCYATGCSTQPAFSGSGYAYCVADTNTVTGFSDTGVPFWLGCISSNNTGSTSVHGFSGPSDACRIYNCTAYGNAGSGFSLGSSNRAMAVVNCLSANNSVWQYTASGVNINVILINCAGWNNGGSGTVNTTQITFPALGFVTLTSDPFVAAGSGNFALTPAAIALLAGIPGVYPGLASTTSFLFIGAVQPAAVRMLYAGDNGE